MPSFEHSNSQPKARKDDHFRPGEEADADVSNEDESIGLGQERLSWGDLAKEPEPESEPEIEPEPVTAQPEVKESPESAITETTNEAASAAKEQPKPQRIDDSNLPDPGPALLQNRQNVGKSSPSSRKRNRPETVASKNLNAGHPMLVESPATTDEKLSGRFADGRPERQPRKLRQPREDRAEQAEKPVANDSTDDAAKGTTSPPTTDGLEEAPKSKRKRSRNRKRKPADGEAREGDDKEGSSPRGNREGRSNHSGEGRQGQSRDGKPREGNRERRQSGRDSQRSGERKPREDYKPRQTSKPAEPEPKGVLGAVKKFFGSLFGAEPAKTEAKAVADKREERQGNRGGQNRGGNRGGQNRGGNRGGQNRGNRGGQNRGGENRGPRPEGEGGEDRPRRRGKRGGKNRRGGNRQGGERQSGERQSGERQPSSPSDS